MEPKVGLRLNTVQYGDGRIFAVDKLNDIVYIEWDRAWAFPDSKVPARKRAHEGQWVREWAEVIGARA